eukprot:scaffold489_cov259-Pinguiococcus_pyrenoidosus.AAC.24
MVSIQFPRLACLARLCEERKEPYSCLKDSFLAWALFGRAPLLASASTVSVFYSPRQGDPRRRHGWKRILRAS